jgi:membrane complex biogenesis BtpA family protein
MLTRKAFAERFGRRALFGMVHLRPLPGAPLFEGSMDSVIDAALADAAAISAGGCDGIVVENFGDRPFAKERVGPETVAAMARIVTLIAGVSKLPIGVNVLRNDAASALGIAAATGATFIRVNVHTGAMLTDQGVIEGRAAETLRLRAALATQVLIFADHLVKHAVPLGRVEPVQSARDLRMRGLADGLIVSGAETGAAPPAEKLDLLRHALADVPLLLGSGLSEQNAGSYAEADGAFFGTAIKGGADVGEPVDREAVERLVAAFKVSGGR